MGRDGNSGGVGGVFIGSSAILDLRLYVSSISFLGFRNSRSPYLRGIWRLNSTPHLDLGIALRQKH